MGALTNVLRHPLTQKLIKTTGLPLRAPPILARAGTPWSARPLEGCAVAVSGDDQIRSVIRALGAAADATDPGTEQHGIVIDARTIADIDGLVALFDFLAPRVRSLASSGRVVVVGTDPAGIHGVRAIAAQEGLRGFTKSLAKEIGRKGATANVLYLSAGTPPMALSGPLAFLLSARSAYVSGQILVVGAAAAPPLVASLKGKTALVTGSVRGIGHAIATILKREGARIVWHDLPQWEHDLAQEAEGDDIVATCDLSDPNTAAQLAAQIKKQCGGLDILVNNAGITRDRTLGNMAREDWTKVLGINCDAALRLTETLTSGKLIASDGAVLFLSSINGIGGAPGQTNYAASKSALIGAVRAMATSQRDLRVNALAPGYIDTTMTQAVPFIQRELGRRMNALGQAGQPADVGEAAAFLVSPMGAGVTGQVLRVCGLHFVGA